MPERTEYVVNTAELEERERIVACRLVLAMTAEDVATFESDVPCAAASGWTAEARQAAEVLSCIQEPGRGEEALYRRTGVVAMADGLTWEAFVTFAPYACDASAWTDNSQRIASIADAADSIVAALTPQQATAVGRAIGKDVVIPIKEWRKRRR